MNNVTPICYTNREDADMVASELGVDPNDEWSYRVVASELCPAFMRDRDESVATLFNVAVYDEDDKYVASF